MKTGIKKIDLQGLVTLALFVAMDIVLEKKFLLVLQL